VLEGPHDFFVRRHFDELRVVRAGVAIAESRVAVGQTLDARHPRQGDAGQIVLLDFPDDFFLRGDLKYAMAIAGADESVPVRQANRTEDRVAESFRSMTALAFFAKKRHFKFPDDLPCPVVLSDDAITFMCDQIMAIGDFANEPRIAV